MPVLTVKYALGAVLAIVNDQPVATRKTLLLCDGPCSEHQVTEQGLVAVFSCADALVHPPQRNPFVLRAGQSGYVPATRL